MTTEEKPRMERLHRQDGTAHYTMLSESVALTEAQAYEDLPERGDVIVRAGIQEAVGAYVAQVGYGRKIEGYAVFMGRHDDTPLAGIEKEISIANVIDLHQSAHRRKTQQDAEDAAARAELEHRPPAATFREPGAPKRAASR
jgi:hypothetical protein